MISVDGFPALQAVIAISNVAIAAIMPAKWLSKLTRYVDSIPDPFSARMVFGIEARKIVEIFKRCDIRTITVENASFPTHNVDIPEYDSTFRVNAMVFSPDSTILHRVLAGDHLPAVIGRGSVNPLALKVAFESVHDRTS
ncbi:MAG: hypothetical protein J6Y83_04845 [Bacteroidales bacterium]|nr:hypothetical protein [Bacteroidales bacterium]